MTSSPIWFARNVDEPPNSGAPRRHGPRGARLLCGGWRRVGPVADFPASWAWWGRRVGPVADFLRRSRADLHTRSIRRMAQFLITRSVHVEAESATVHALVDDFHRWVEWSPWEGLDPQLQRTYSGADRGTGARYAWQGNNKAGQGTMTITESTPDRIGIDLAFLKPFKATNHVALTFAPDASGGTDVTWTMTGERGAFGQVFAKVFKMDDKLGGDFVKGLLQLKALAEKA